MTDRGVIPPTENRKVQIDHDKALDKHRRKIENMFGRLKDWRRHHPLRLLRPHGGVAKTISWGRNDWLRR